MPSGWPAQIRSIWQDNEVRRGDFGWSGPPGGERMHGSDRSLRVGYRRKFSDSRGPLPRTVRMRGAQPAAVWQQCLPVVPKLLA